MASEYSQHDPFSSEEEIENDILTLNTIVLSTIDNAMAIDYSHPFSDSSS